MTDLKQVAGTSDQEFYARQQARIARRKSVAEREDRINSAVVTGFGILLGAIFLYLVLFWAAM